MRRMSLYPVLIGISLIGCSGSVQRAPAPPSPLPKKVAHALVSEACKHVGEPYRYGGTSTRGWDCSGFVRTMYKRTLDIDLPRKSHDIYLQSFPIPWQRGRAGDLIFFRIDSKKPSHVGIYLGGNSFIHVSISDGVIVSSLMDDYYRQYFSGIRRYPSLSVASLR